jgi:hypothetical protein
MNLDLYNRVKEVPDTAKKIIGAGKLAGVETEVAE